MEKVSFNLKMGSDWDKCSCLNHLTWSNIKSDYVDRNNLTSSNPKIEFNPSSIKDVIFDEERKTTVVKWKDGKTTVVTCLADDVYSKEVGLITAVVKYMCGNKGSFNNWVEYWTTKKEREAAEFKAKKEAMQAKKDKELAKLIASKKAVKEAEVKEREQKIEIQKEAYKRAIQELGLDKVALEIN